MLKFGWLSRLYASARNWIRKGSFSTISFCSERSNSSSPGPITALRGALPKLYSAGSVKTDVSNHCCGVVGRCSDRPKCWDAGRPAPMLAWSLEILTVNGAPDCAVKFPPACHWPNAARTHRLSTAAGIGIRSSPPPVPMIETGAGFLGRPLYTFAEGWLRSAWRLDRRRRQWSATRSSSRRTSARGEAPLYAESECVIGRPAVPANRVELA